MPGENYLLPLFPLETVLFPGMTLPLRIFEPRYRQMLADCLDNEPVFGVVLIREGTEVGATAIPHDVGTTARIIGVHKRTPELTDITAVGEERFRLRRIFHDKPYLVGVAEPFPLTSVDTPQNDSLVQQGEILLEHYLKLLSKAAGNEIKLQRAPETPESLAFLTAMVLQVAPLVKQHLLSIADLPTLFHTEAALLENERKVLTVMIQAIGAGRLPKDADLPFSRN